MITDPFLRAVFVWGHPFVAAIAIAFALRAATLAFAGRRRPRSGQLARHPNAARIAFALLVAAFASGLVTVVSARPDLEPAESGHFQVGAAITLLFSASALLAPDASRPWARLVHPWVGALALVACGFQVLLGMALLP